MLGGVPEARSQTTLGMSTSTPTKNGGEGARLIRWRRGTSFANAAVAALSL